ncbi:DUF1330 domain-containing protein [Nocardia sp. NPDC003183]
MSLYLMSFATIDDREAGYEYSQQARSVIRKYGGEFVVRGVHEETLQGVFEPSGRVPTVGMVQRWPDRATLDRMLASTDYLALQARRAEIMTPTVVLLSALDNLEGGSK